jgi:hypothetical protein
MATLSSAQFYLLDKFDFLPYGKSNSPADEAFLTSILFQVDSVVCISISMIIDISIVTMIEICIMVYERTLIQNLAILITY